MAKEIKNFEVWHPPAPTRYPPPPPKDDLLYKEVEPTLPSWLIRGRHKLTFTGAVWMFVPFIFIFWKRLSFSLKEFLIWVIAWGASAGSVAAMLKGLNCPWPALIVVLYAVSHLHCMLFTSAVYHSRLNGGHYRRMLHVLFPQVLLCVLFNGISLMAVR